MATYLILGSGSFYGTNFAKLLRERGERIATCKHYGPIHGSYDYVVNFASKSLVEESWAAPADWAKANVSDFSNLLNDLRGRVKKFIHISTPEVYGSTPDWVDETYKDWKPSTPYAVTRAAGDMMLMAYLHAYGFPGLITRTANIYGHGQQEYRIIPKSIKYKKECKVLPLQGMGASRRSFIHVSDACEALYLLCKEGRVGETYHISTREWHSIKDVVEMVGCQYAGAPERLGKDEAYLLDSTKIRKMGWEDTITLEEGLRELSR